MVEPELEMFREVEGHKSSASDRHNDFRAVFLRDEQSRRVLWEILSKCRIYNQSASLNNPNETYLREGMRSIGLWMMATLTKQPNPPPTKSENVKRDTE